MKFTAQEEYGLRCLLRIAKNKNPDGMTIPEISNAEGISQAHAAKLLRIMRLGGLLQSTRGKQGGYTLSKRPDEINLGEVLNILDGKLFDISFCGGHTGIENICTHDINCSIRSLWRVVQNTVDSVLTRTTLQNLIGTEEQVEISIRF